ncbi:MAG: hypothetical protein HGA22_01100 [Clostridiales bacterium]|nr:hypothetical protein [Clostridiales bacterium]
MVAERMQMITGVSITTLDDRFNREIEIYKSHDDVIISFKEPDGTRIMRRFTPEEYAEFIEIIR